MSILITGGLGFIGSHLTKYYLDRGEFVTIIDNHSTSSLEEASLVFDIKNPNLEILSIDLASPGLKEKEQIDAAVKEARLVHHLASPVGVRYVDSHPDLAIRNGISINLNFFPYLEKYQKKVLFSSSSEVYGETEEARETDVLKIGSPDVLRWGYACGKLMSEFLLKTYTFPHVILRVFNVTGKGQRNQHGMVLPTFIGKAKNNEPLIVYGDGSQFRSFCDIRDAVNIFALLGEDEIHVGETYNVGNPEGLITIKELAQLVKDVSGASSPIVHKDFNQEFKNSVDIMKRSPNADKIKKYYQFRYTLKDTIRYMLT